MKYRTPQTQTLEVEPGNVSGPTITKIVIRDRLSSQVYDVMWSQLQGDLLDRGVVH